ncbi:glycosyltransferase family 4 protein [Desulfosediminicola flagellatus]|uniref:glycosyltransferase family 4 protein n=1 Tax=Desulfosediminicola flagellatus TaxID=2569541 RepID=UPI0010ACCF72|nr:glycosyltransferase family 4 protein [Desulfosediminicola flagellatus]
MKILHLNNFDITGGAARAAYRIHAALRECGIHSEMLVARKNSLDRSVRCYPVPYQVKKNHFIKKLLGYQKTSNPSYHSLNLFQSGIYKIINRIDADIINIHWIGKELISISELKKINKPIVWTLHDMWAFCGAEHYDSIDFSNRYRERYTNKNRPTCHKGWVDLDGSTWRRKKKHWHNVNFNFVTPSRWMAECLCMSSLFFGEKATVIPNCLNTDVFKPTDKNNARKSFNLPQEKQLILFGADGGSRNPLKGFHFLKQALETFASGSEVSAIECITFGGKCSGRSTIKGIPVTEVGRINDDHKLAMLYSLADVFIIPSMMDNLPNTVMEAMSCGTPCVGFGIGGIPDMIDHLQNGFLVSPFDTNMLAEGIKWVLGDIERHYKLSKAAREKVVCNYAYTKVAEQYIDVYKRITN